MIQMGKRLSITVKTAFIDGEVIARFDSPVDATLFCAWAVDAGFYTHLDFETPDNDYSFGELA